MATEKRQRQDQRREEKLKEVVAITEKQKTMKKRKRFLSFLIPGVLIVGAALFWPRGNGGDDTAAKDTTASSTAPAVTTTTLPKAIAKKPEVTVPAVAPAKVETKNIAVGTGPEAVKGSDLKLNYVGMVLESKKQFASTWDAIPPSLFEVKGVGNGGIIDGLAEGLIGMKQGGRRQIIVPAAKAYGKEGSAALGIKPGESLVYIVDAVEVIPPTK